MWLFTTRGYYSIVQKPEDRARGTLTVRARRRDDLARLGLDVEIEHTPLADYPYRQTVDRHQLAEVIAGEVTAIDYPNYKDTLPTWRHRLYLRIWALLIDLEPRRRELSPLPLFEEVTP